MLTKDARGKGEKSVFAAGASPEILWAEKLKQWHEMLGKPNRTPRC